MSTRNLISQLVDESVFIIREVAAQFERPVVLYSVGKDSSVLVHLLRKAFYPGKVPFQLLHIDTGFKFPEMYEFRDALCKKYELNLKVFKNESEQALKANPWDLGTQACCGILKTGNLLQALAEGKYDAAIGGARRDEEWSRAKERIFSFRDALGQWEPRRQRPELWSQYNGKVRQGESMRVFPISNWTETDVWDYIQLEDIPIVPLYFAREREVIVRGGALFPIESYTRRLDGDRIEKIWCRFRSLGCTPCTGAYPSRATTLAEVIAEMRDVQSSERALRVIDHDEDGSMETKKRQGYF
jgi:sulfate adenylyltransferase subunit 2